jgi:hypothetical protein
MLYNADIPLCLSISTNTNFHAKLVGSSLCCSPQQTNKQLAMRKAKAAIRKFKKYRDEELNI